MAKKRKASRAVEAPSGPRDYDARDARIGVVDTFADIADEQEQHFLDQDKIALDEERGTKRQRQQQREDEFVDLSDDEVFRRDSDDSANESEPDAAERRKLKKKDKKAKAKAAKAQRAALSDDDDDEAPAGKDDEADAGWWGSSKEHYYDGDAIETEDGAMEEEAEARRLQKKQLSRMKASDFFDADEWATEATATDKETTAALASAATSSGPAVRLSIMGKAEVDAMAPEERYAYLQEQYPEIDHLCDEFSELEKRLPAYKTGAENKAPTSLEVVLFRSLSCYVATMALYFSLLMSPSRDDPTGTRYVMDPEELHNHEVMESLVRARAQWAWAAKIEARRAAKAAVEAEAAAEAEAEAAAAVDDVSDASEVEAAAVAEKKLKKKADKAKKKKASAASKAVEASLADLADLIPKKGAEKKTKKVKTIDVDDDAGHSDLGEETTMDARTADEKAKRKKSLGFYTSQIMQKSSMRTGATGAAGGDMDIPYRERLRDRQERLTAAAVRRGLNDAPENELGAGSDSDSGSDAGSDDEADAERAANLSYYDSVVRAHKEKMQAKKARADAAEAAKLDRVDPAQWADEDGRRQLTWEIEKNKGLSHKTLKEKKNNPRVKKRIKYEKKKKQLASMRATYKPMNPSDYQGERTGIKTGLIRSIKLD